MVRAQTRRHRRTLWSALLTGAGGASLAVAAGAWWRHTGESPPNILIVTMCSWRLERIGAYGGTSGSTPRFDALAAKSIVFDHAWSNGVYTSVAHAALLTGRYPEGNGLIDATSTIDRSVPTLPEILKLYGYHTLAWTTANAPLSFRAQDGFERGFDRFDQPETSAQGRVARFAPPESPWLAVAHVKDTHVPYDVDGQSANDPNPVIQEWLTRTRRRLPGDPDPDARVAEQFATDPEAKTALLRRYDADLHSGDARLGELLDTLGDQLEDTVVIVVGDHGDALGEHGRIGHGALEHPPSG